MQAADLFAWTVNRHLRQEDQDLLATSAVIAINHASRIYDFETICGTHDAYGKRLATVAPGFEPTMFRMRFR
jgi:ATP-dependent phosphoenolpyruvate carboxykinase